MPVVCVLAVLIFSLCQGIPTQDLFGLDCCGMSVEKVLRDSNVLN